MSKGASQVLVTNNGPSEVQRELGGPLNISELNGLAVRGLVRMFDDERQLFCFRLKRTRDGLTREGHSVRYTLISLLGLRQLERRGLTSPIQVKATLDRLLENTSWVDNLGDLGLLLWLCALTSPERLERLFADLDVRHALRRYADARTGRTMELAWFLSGLAHGTLAHGEKIPDLTDSAATTYRLLRNNQGPKGMFGHLARTQSLAGVLRGRIGSFADQIYPIYALTRFAQAYNVEEALRVATNCAEALCQVQGPLGQWYWHYDASTGKVLRRYPVYSVHQHGMGPMALLALGDAVRMDFSDAVCKGVQWLADNEKQADMRDTSTGVIWRGLYREKHKMYFSELLNLVNFRNDRGSFTDLEIKFECRSYELGWLLYAFADRNLLAGVKPQEAVSKSQMPVRINDDHSG